jgi:TPR repeat protein
MKKLITIYLLIAFGITLTSYSQTLSGEYNNDGSSTPSYYTRIKWEVSYSFIEKNGLFYMKFYNPKIKVPNYALYHDEFGKEYSLSDLNLGVWPAARQLPFAMSVKVNISDGFNNYESTSSCNSNFTCNENYIADKANLKNVAIGNFRVTGVTYFHANLGGEPAVDAILKNKRQSGNKSATTSSNTTTTPSTSTENTNSNSISETPVYTPTYTKQDVTNQVINQAATLAGGLINDWNANYERKQKIRETENNEKWNRIDQRAMNRFKFYYDQLINLANSGNENAQMILYLESDGAYGKDRAKALPLREVWYEKALKNKNTIALLTKINTSGYYIFEPYEENKQLLHELADAGNVDAMVMLGLWYSQRPNRPSYIYKQTIYDTTHGHIKGGSNQELAIKYLTAAAEKGSPNAMYYLGLIYRDGKIDIIYYPLKFKIEKNEKLAFEWFSKSIIPSYKESLYYTHHITNGFYNGSYFEDSSYFALAEMYEKGQGVPKDIEKAQELRRLGKERYEYIHKNRGFIE